MFRIAFATLLILAASAGKAQGFGPIVGHIDGNTYHLANGAFAIAIPVLPQLGGSITDTPNVVTFEDAYSTHVSIAAFPQDPTQRWELSTRGPKDYLIYFFTNFVLRDFTKAFRSVHTESEARFAPSLFDGALFTYILLPGGSMFIDKIVVIDPARLSQLVAKRGNLIFVKNGFIYVISCELAERVTEGSAYHQTPAEEDALLRDRLVRLAGTIQFSPPPASSGPSAK